MVEFYLGNQGHLAESIVKCLTTVITIPAGAAIQTNPILIAKGLAAGTGIIRMSILTSAALAGVTKFKVALHNSRDPLSTDEQILANIAAADVNVPTVAAPAVVNFGTNTALPIGTIIGKSIVDSGFRLFLVGDAASTNEATLTVVLEVIDTAMRFSALTGKTTVTETLTPAT